MTFKNVVLVLIIFSSILSAYVGNKNSYKFHEDNCRSVYQMKEKNKEYFKNRDDAIRKCYIPCKVCKP